MFLKSTVAWSPLGISTDKMAVFYYIGVFTLLFFLYCLIKLLQFVFSDCDMQLRSCRLKREYFKDKVVWLVGASGGSK